ncbi:hypothetical protein [Microbacterium profundi]
MVSERRVDHLLDGRSELRIQLNRAVVLDHGVLDKVERKVTRVASAFLPRAAEEVEVLLLRPSK